MDEKAKALLLKLIEMVWLMLEDLEGHECENYFEYHEGAMTIYDEFKNMGYID